MGGFKALLNAGDRFGENFLARRASESALYDLQIHAGSSNWCVLDFHYASIVNRIGSHGATGADFKLGLFSAFVARSKLIALPVRNNPKLWQKNEFGRRFPIGILQQLLFEI